LAYYGQSQHGFAIEIKNAVFFKTPIEPKDLSQDFIPPQSFRYFTETSIPANAKSLYGVDAEYP
jgi:hypothetical protein